MSDHNFLTIKNKNMLIFYHLSAYLSIVYLILAKMAEFNIEPVNTLESSKNKTNIFH